MKIELKKDIPKSIESLIEQEQIAYECAHNISCNYTPFYMVAKEQDTVLGVISGYTCYAEVYIDDILVCAQHRGRGVGKALLQAVQTQFSNNKFNNINLVTNAFQAPGFYEKCGFTLEFTRHNKQNPLLTKHFYVKFI